MERRLRIPVEVAVNYLSGESCSRPGCNGNMQLYSRIVEGGEEYKLVCLKCGDRVELDKIVEIVYQVTEKG